MLCIVPPALRVVQEVIRETNDMKFKLEMSCDSAAFGDDMIHTIYEAARMLRDLGFRLEGEARESGILYDFNGNKVGHYGFEGKRDDQDNVD